MTASPSAHSQTLNRDLFLTVVRTALNLGELRFARAAVTAWLGNYPGDLLAGYYHASVLLTEKNAAKAAAIAESLCHIDPEFTQAQQLILMARRQADLAINPTTLSNLIALGEKVEGHSQGDRWGFLLWQARRALKAGKPSEAEQVLTSILALDPASPMLALTHLQILQAQEAEAPLAARCSLAELYHQRWPRCLGISLLLADWLMQSDQSERAVALLHQAAAQDVAGQVAARLWGNNHPYRAIWPEGLTIDLPLAIPVSVLAALGLNLLPEGEILGEVEPELIETATIALDEAPSAAAPSMAAPLMAAPIPEIAPVPAPAKIQPTGIAVASPAPSSPNHVVFEDRKSVV
jgi:hypothetical protein